MARGLNKVQLIGNIGREPEFKQIREGLCVCRLVIATTDCYKDKATGQRVEETQWHSVELWNRLAEIANEYSRKGRQVYIEGKLKTDKWQDAEGKDQYRTKIVANDLQLLGGRGHDNADSGPTYQSQEPAPAPAPQSQGGNMGRDDDVPL